MWLNFNLLLLHIIKIDISPSQFVLQIKKEKKHLRLISLVDSWYLFRSPHNNVIESFHCMCYVHGTQPEYNIPNCTVSGTHHRHSSNQHRNILTWKIKSCGWFRFHLGLVLVFEIIDSRRSVPLGFCSGCVQFKLWLYKLLPS